MAGNPHVIAGKKEGARLIDLQKPWRRLRATANVHDVRIHDLRHSFASIAAGVGTSLPMIGKLLGHTQPATTARYAHLAADPIRAASNLIGSGITAAMNSTKRPQADRRPPQPPLIANPVCGRQLLLVGLANRHRVQLKFRTRLSTLPIVKTLAKIPV